MSLTVSFTNMISGYVLIFCAFFIITKSALACYTSIFALGDSLNDNGNLLLFSAPKIIHQGCLPNGETYFHHPTGRCCDGRLIIDFLAERFGVPLLPPFAGLKNASNRDIQTGVNFAVAGARALDTAYYDEIGIFDPVTNASLRVQMGWFKDLLPSFCGTIPVAKQGSANYVTKPCVCGAGKTRHVMMKPRSPTTDQISLGIFTKQLGNPRNCMCTKAA